MPDIDLDAIKARAEAATPGPWELDKVHHTCYLEAGDECEHPNSLVTDRTLGTGVDGSPFEHHTHESYEAHEIEPRVAGNYDYEAGGIINTVDAEFIAAARTDIPALLAEVERLTAQVNLLAEHKRQMWIELRANGWAQS